jgi:hypothetical protein
MNNNLSKESILEEEDIKDFLLFLYFGRDKDFIMNSINRAYRDFNRTLHGFSKTPKKDKINVEVKLYINNEILKLKDTQSMNSQELFDLWHKQTCIGIKEIFVKNGVSNFYLGQSQKWINMTLKYIFLYGENKINGFKNIYGFCHIPLDNIILDKIDNKYFNTTWSRIDDYSNYLSFQIEIRKIADDLAPLDYEFKLFMSN